MAKLQEKLAAVIPGRRDEIRGIIKEHADKVVSEVTVKQVYGGMRGVKGLNCDTSVVPPDKGMVVRGHEVLTLTDRLPGRDAFVSTSFASNPGRFGAGAR